MSIITEVLRSQLLDEITKVEIIPQITFRGWIANKSYRISTPLENKNFTLDIYSREELLLPFAHDINRMATSSFESIHGITPERNLPKSLGWLIIRAYYSAYFSTHALLRLFGISCSQFDNNECSAVTEVARLYSFQNGITISSGYYECNYQNNEEKMVCKQLNNTHQDVWKIFYELLERVSEKIAVSDYRQAEKELVIDYLFFLRKGLSNKGAINNGNWLSKIRNSVNYSHSMGAWYPYNNSSKEHKEMFRLIAKWKESPSKDLIESNSSKCDNLLYIATCTSITSLCYAIVNDLVNLNEKIFLRFSPIRLIKHIT